MNTDHTKRTGFREAVQHRLADLIVFVSAVCFSLAIRAHITFAMSLGWFFTCLVIAFVLFFVRWRNDTAAWSLVSRIRSAAIGGALLYILAVLIASVVCLTLRVFPTWLIFDVVSGSMLLGWSLGLAFVQLGIECEKQLFSIISLLPIP